MSSQSEILQCVQSNLSINYHFTQSSLCAWFQSHVHILDFCYNSTIRFLPPQICICYLLLYDKLPHALVVVKWHTFVFHFLRIRNRGVASLGSGSGSFLQSRCQPRCSPVKLNWGKPTSRLPHIAVGRAQRIHLQVHSFVNRPHFFAACGQETSVPCYTGFSMTLLAFPGTRDMIEKEWDRELTRWRF